MPDRANLQPIKVPDRLQFGRDFEFDLRSHELRRAGHVLRLERIPTEILAFLLDQRGQLVSREQIVEKVWGKGVFLDTDNSINGAVRKIRQVLSDSPEEPRFIQTITAGVTDLLPRLWSWIEKARAERSYSGNRK